MIKVYGYSDDNIVCEGAPYPYDEIGCYNNEVEITFADGTVIRAGYPKESKAIWWIKREKLGKAPARLIICKSEEENPYSDVFEIESIITGVKVGDKPLMAQGK